MVPHPDGNPELVFRITIGVRGARSKERMQPLFPSSFPSHIPRESINIIENSYCFSQRFLTLILLNGRARSTPRRISAFSFVKELFGFAWGQAIFCPCQTEEIPRL